MTDAEAEAALLALGGPPLCWLQDKRLGEVADTGEGFYLVEKDTFLGFTLGHEAIFNPFEREITLLGRRVHMCDVHIHYENPIPAPDRCTRRYKSLAAAKAACERHHATGKWD